MLQPCTSVRSSSTGRDTCRRSSGLSCKPPSAATTSSRRCRRSFADSASTTSRMPRPTITSVPTTTSACTCSRRCRRPGWFATTNARTSSATRESRFVFDNALPLVWDQASERGRGVRTDEFLENAAALRPAQRRRVLRLFDLSVPQSRRAQFVAAADRPSAARARSRTTSARSSSSDSISTICSSRA